METSHARRALPLLKVCNLTTTIRTDAGVVIPCDDVSFDVSPGQVLGIVGESGSGKSMTALSILRLLPTGASIKGQVLLQGTDLTQLPEEAMRRIRGQEIAMIFQEPMSALNPVYTIGTQIQEAILLHRQVRKDQARARSIELLQMVGIPEPERRVKEFPHQLSGGMQQRAMIAMALACDPRILIADEPTTALDVTVQAQILELLQSLQRETGMGVILITHDLGVVAEVADRVLVMYAGQIVEEAEVGRLFSNALHPYTRGLLESIPQLESEQERLKIIPGAVPSLRDVPSGCRFSPRCQYKQVRCSNQAPTIRNVSEDTTHLVRCWLYQH